MAYRLAIRGANVEFVNPKHVNIKLGHVETPSYCIGDGRDDYESYVFKLFNSSSKSSKVNVEANHKELLDEDGSILAIQAWVQGRPLEFYNWVQTRQILKSKMGTHFDKFGKSLESYGLCDGKYFQELESTYYLLSNNPAKLVRSLKGYTFNLNPLREASNTLLQHELLMRDLDKYVALCQNKEKDAALESQLEEEDIKLIYEQLVHKEGLGCAEEVELGEVIDI